MEGQSQAEAVENTPGPSVGRLHPLKGSGTQSEPVPIALRAAKGVMREQMVYFIKAFVEVEAAVGE